MTINAWEKRELGEIFNVVTDYVANGSFKSLRQRVSTYSNPNFAYMIRLQDASNNWKGPWLYTDQQSYSFLAKTKLHPGDILMSNVGSVGKFFLVPDLDRPMTLAPNAVLLRSMTYSTYFLFQLLQTSSMTESINEKTTPGVQQKINKTDFKKIITNVPTLNESSMVGQMLFLLDNLIAATQRRISALEEIKEALSQYLFVQKWRFRGYSNPWKRVVLGEIADIIGGGTPKTDEPKFWNGEIDWYAPAEIGSNRYVAGSVRTITSVGLNKSSASILPANRTILFTSRAGIGNAAILKKDAATNQGFQSLVLKDGVDIYFIYSRIPEIKQKAIRIAAGSTFLEISGKKLSQIALLVPELNEQQKIGAFLKKLDDLVAANHSKVSRLNLLKKFLLQGLFI
ncbi:restriction endonuclease subunit S [Lacticaseibacillus paracasei]|uniref:restriction endonuclease subunit S n=1 Tax=Lacticaseibacillus paracasei TaxID=1597 RepID=UPI0021E7C899|nr:restriction endonuclease subunit S [Lacticaseibacillus paracasei]WKF68054.1 restriction endonuclease subunit S [Lacticaseibacillus paracasei]